MNYLKEVWIQIIIKKINICKEFVIKAFLGSEKTGLFMCSEFEKKYNFELLKLK